MINHDCNGLHALHIISQETMTGVWKVLLGRNLWTEEPNQRTGEPNQKTGEPNQ